ncbi:hypothetical protein ElyMa_001014300 [Elysia marginata]|uniref:Uncharacterized protein n=1 Tax=Elysia marginata TaxID=1093978 RepID=A0AAV4HLN3_9GAST|nr:hypothetical protein ElyMa_001014300 [Elysia marginata]
MARRKTPTSSQMSLSLAALLVFLVDLLLIGCTDALLPSDELAYSPKYFEHLSGRQQDIADARQQASQQSSDGQQQHLMKLLSMKSSLSDLLAPNQVEALSDSGNEDSQLDISANGGDGVYSDIQPPADKRVFCNVFTGCGGRFRAQQGQHGTDKRVFCNSQGCRNGGRKRGMLTAAAAQGDAKENKGGFDMKLWKQALKRLEELHLGKLRGLSKRLFCNYGGCHNVGKRRGPTARHSQPSFPSEDAKASIMVNSFLPKLEFVSSRQGHSNQKRFFSGGADADLDALINSFR